MIRDRVGAAEDRFFATVFLGSGLLFVGMLFVASSVAAGLVAAAGDHADSLLSSGAWAVGRERHPRAHGRLRDADGRRVHARRLDDPDAHAARAALARRIRVRDRGRAPDHGRLTSPGSSSLFPAWVLVLSVYVLVTSFRGTSAGGASGVTTWATRFRRRQSVRQSLWLVPLLGASCRDRPGVGRRLGGPEARHARGPHLHAVDCLIRALGDSRRRDRAHRLRRHRDRAPGADRHQPVLGAVHAVHLPRPAPEGGPGGPGRDVRLLVRASSPGRRDGITGPRPVPGRRARSPRNPPLPPLLLAPPPPAAPRGRRGLRQRARPRGVPRARTADGDRRAAPGAARERPRNPEHPHRHDPGGLTRRSRALGAGPRVHARVPSRRGRLRPPPRTPPRGLGPLTTARTPLAIWKAWSRSGRSARSSRIPPSPSA